MVHRWAALALVLALCAFTPKHAAGQQQPRGRKAGSLGQNYPNPANPETAIPFTVGDDSCAAGGPEHVVSIRIYNILSQLVGVPKLRMTTPRAGSDSTASVSKPVQNLKLACGSYTAFWDGKSTSSGREVPAGTYVYELIVDGQREVRKMLVAK